MLLIWNAYKSPIKTFTIQYLKADTFALIFIFQLTLPYYGDNFKYGSLDTTG